MLDVTFYRDDFRRRELIAPSENKIDFIVENLKVIILMMYYLQAEQFVQGWMHCLILDDRKN
jgi:hypothetical protein